MNTRSITLMRRSATIAATCTTAALLLSACGSDSSGDSSPTSHQVKVSLREVPVIVTQGPNPGPPQLAKEAGILTGSLGNGADRTDVRVVDGTGKREFFLRGGSMYGTFVFDGERKSNGDTIVGTMTVTGGSGKYAGAHGKLAINGFHYDKEAYSHEDLSGTVTY